MFKNFLKKLALSRSFAQNSIFRMHPYIPFVREDANLFMKKTRSLLYCLLASGLLSVSACTTAHRTTVSPPPPIQLIQSPNYLRVVLYSDLCFRSNGKLTAECFQQLQQVTETIKKLGNGPIQVIGYTDDIYDPQTARQISLRQANAVLAILWIQGIESHRLCSIGLGVCNPIASNRSTTAIAANRRVEIVLIK